MNEAQVEKIFDDIVNRRRPRPRRDVKMRVEVIIKEGKRMPRVDPVFGKEALALIDAKKLKPIEQMGKRSSVIKRARRRYVLGDDDAIVDT